MKEKAPECACGCGGKTFAAKKTDRRRGAKRGVYNRFLWGHNNLGIALGELEGITQELEMLDEEEETPW